jgi:hypothetical protein
MAAPQSSGPSPADLGGDDEGADIGAGDPAMSESMACTDPAI